MVGPNNYIDTQMCLYEKIDHPCLSNLQLVRCRSLMYNLATKLILLTINGAICNAYIAEHLVFILLIQGWAAVF